MEPQYKIYERQHREEYHSLAVGLVLPFTQSLVTGGLIGAVLSVGYAWLRSGEDWLFIPLVMLGAVLVGWIMALSWWRNLASQYDRVEEPLTYYPPVEPERELLPAPNLRLELVEPGGLAGSFVNFPVDASRLIVMARALSSGKPFTEASFVSGSHGLFTRAEFCQLRDELRARQLLEPVSSSTPARGFRLTPGGRAAMKYLSTLQA